MPDYKIFWKAKERGPIKGSFTTETIGKTTRFYNMKGDEFLVVRHKRKKLGEADVDRWIRELAVLDPEHVFKTAEQEYGARDGIGQKDIRMPQEAARRFEEQFYPGLELMEWVYYKLNVRGL